MVKMGNIIPYVVDGPIFSKRICIRESKIVKNKEMNFLEILDFDLEQKAGNNKI